MHIPNITINIIVSVSENWVIGKNNKLLWKLNSDLKKFKELTLGHPVIMGQKTFESLPNGALPNRTNIVLTDDINFSASNVVVAYNINDALLLAESYCGDSDDVFIIGGGMIYKQFLDMANFVYLTTVHTIIDGDTTFPKLDDNWKLISEEFKSKDDKNDYDHTYKKYKHIKYLYDDEDVLNKELTTKEKEERNNEILPNGFVDWNKFSLDELADYLEKKWMFSSSGEALAIFKMVDFYRKHKNIKNNFK
ncbi:dihydrofolate reductase [Candidatus Dojkabacteria bacterium]|jgi:dihydrofolate reductase|nr:dihydrofolate reductase [Candidatus Dojkabacteria bacterium]